MLPRAKPFERRVAFTVDGKAVDVTVWSDMSALLAVRLVARHDRPRRGCEAGLCGSCESLVDGEVTRLCQLPSTALDATTVVTGPVLVSGAPPAGRA